MIPKIIHYCWYGRGEKDALTLRCIESWKQYCPDYKIIEWNEENSDISSSNFAKEAYDKRKWAFVSDYCRLKALYEYGGVYLDTDVELLQNLDIFLNDDAFLGYADDTYIGSGMLGCLPKNVIYKEFLNYYDNKHFIKEDGSFNDTPNNKIYTAICLKKLGLELGKNYMEYGNLKIYPSEFFSPFKKNIIGNPEKIYSIKNFKCKDNTYAIHYTVCSWKNTVAKKSMLIFNQIIRRMLPTKLYFALKKRAKLKEVKKLLL